MKYLATIGDTVYRISLTRENGGFAVELDGEQHRVFVTRLDANRFTITLGSRCTEVHFTKPSSDTTVLYIDNIATCVDIVDEKRIRRRKLGLGGSSRQTITSPMPGKVVKILKHAGDTVKPGEGVIIIEAMKMENELRAAAAGTIASVSVAVGDTVEGGQALVVIDPPANPAQP